jgi:nucleoside-diphosphate-sugar epimerase
MPSPTLLLIGGTGTISHAVALRAVEQGFDVTLLNRGATSVRGEVEGTEVVQADIRDILSVGEALGRREFDVVADFVAFTPQHAQGDVDFFAGRTGQYVFISSASAYQKPVMRLPITESTPLVNPFWQYSRDKIACEDLLMGAYRDSAFPVTIIRPSHTYDETSLPLNGGWTAMQRMLDGRPVIMHGDGTSLWVLTHSRDFAKGFVGLLGNPTTVGEAFTITSDEVNTWDTITRTLGSALGVVPTIAHVTSDALAAADPEMGPGHIGDRSNSVIFDNAKLRHFVPDYVATTTWAQGAREIAEWRLAHPELNAVDPRLDALFDRLAG